MLLSAILALCSEANLFRKILVELASQLLRIKLFMLSLLHCSADVCVCSYPGKTGWIDRVDGGG